MREVAFIRQNHEKWSDFELKVKSPQKGHADELARQFIEVTDDLAYAQTFYPKSKTTQYLNSMACLTHQQVYRNKKEKPSRILDYWRYELPTIFKKHHRTFLYATLTFLIAVGIGVISTAYDQSFIRLILGDFYVNMTLDNIKKGDPMAVYKGSDELIMSSYITINNIRVSFLAFAGGILFGFGTVYILFTNGIMLGAFFTFFYQHDLLLESFRVVWIHGAFEISVILVAGWAGMVLGNSILFPQTYSRGRSLAMGAKDSVKILLSSVPFFIIAGFLEGFVTRHTEMPLALSLFIILGSFSTIILFYVISPYIINPPVDHDRE